MQKEELAYSLLESEFECYNNDKSNYMRSMGWQKQIIDNHKDTEIVFDKHNVKDLSQILEAEGLDNFFTAFENDKVSDYLVNTVADEIIKYDQ